MTHFSLITAATIMLSTSAVHAHEPVKSTNIQTPYERGLNLELYELPIKVQNAVKKVCEGEIISITQIFVYSNIFYKIICEEEGEQNVYLFDTEGLPPSIADNRG